MEESRAYRKKDSQWNPLFPLFFQEYMYTLAYDHSLNGSFFYEHVDVEIMDSNAKLSFVLVKQLITRMYQQNFAIYSVNDYDQNRFIGHSKNLYSHFFSQMISEIFGVIVEILFSQRLGYSFEEEEKEISKFHNLQSIHSIFPFLEDKLSHLNYVSHILIPYPIHIEILVQILQCWAQDVSFLHLLQFFLRQYQYYKWKSSIISTFISTTSNSNKFFLYIFSKEKKRLFQLLYNFYISEFEFVLVFFRKKYCYLGLTSSGAFIERTHFYGKIKSLVNVFINYFHKNIWCFRDFFIHYARYKRKAIFGSRGTRLIIKKWEFYLVNLWQYYFQFLYQSDRVEHNQLLNYSFFFLGYLSSVSINLSSVRNQILENSYIIEIETKKLDTIVSFVSLIQSLSSAQFCTAAGHSISKSIWTDLSDSDIIDRFGRICRNIFHYYSGSSKKKSLYQVKYILKLSCARTLSRKHKSTGAFFVKKLDSSLFSEFFTEKPQVLGLIFPKNLFPLQDLHILRIWNLDIIYMNNLVNDS
uniref:Maturase K n=2 Tax=Burmannia TaxID=48531 RepID=A0A2H4FHI5_9LILI|nr:maturase K [Burmannia nepalensis]YP_009450282.1 maturase K [Burmannia nepalensis]AOV94008.1 maturase K [Burmannia nepalensis]AOV94015.1 maturase K [Burmannia nepalensis]